MIAITTILLPVLIIVSLVLVFILKRNPNKKRSFFYGQKVKWFFFGYVMLLILSVIVYTFILEERANGEEEAQGEDVEFATTDLGSDRLIRIENAEEKHRAKWDYDQQKLHIDGDLGVYDTIPIIIDKKEVNDGEIEVVYYMGRSTIESYDISDQFKPMDFNLEDDELTITRTNVTHIEASAFSKEFTMNQFTEEIGGETGPFMNRGTFIGKRVIYLRIPKDLQLTYDDLNVLYVR